MKTGAEIYCERIDVELTPAQVAASRYLEIFGFRFGIDFGYENACRLARLHWLNELPIADVRRH